VGLSLFSCWLPFLNLTCAAPSQLPRHVLGDDPRRVRSSSLWSPPCCHLTGGRADPLSLAPLCSVRPFRPTPKFLCVKGILFFSFWQSIAISLLVKWGAIKSVGTYTDHEVRTLSGLKLRRAVTAACWTDDQVYQRPMQVAHLRLPASPSQHISLALNNILISCEMPAFAVAHTYAFCVLSDYGELSLFLDCSPVLHKRG
jgi:hypothetical protein